MSSWLIGGAIAVVVLFLVVRRLFRGPGGASSGDRVAGDARAFTADRGFGNRHVPKSGAPDNRADMLRRR